MRPAVAVLACVVSFGTAGRALACGASGGAAGVSACSLSEHEEALRRKWRVGATYGYTATTIVFRDDLRLDETRHTALATLDWAPSRDWTFEAGAGGILGGAFRRSGETHAFRPGALLDVGAAFRALDADGARPFVVGTAQLSYLQNSTREVGSTVTHAALDLRLGALVGWSIADVLRPYVLARVFGGPVFWRYRGESVTGTDSHHYQLGAGAVLTVARRVDLFAEGVPLGERGITAGAGVLF